jgi:serine/threonine protein kinase
MERFRDYVLARRLDAGGDVAFYEAQHDSGERRLLIQAPTHARHWPPWADPALATILRHPNIVTTCEAAAFAHEPYFVLEFVDGIDLRELLVGGRLPPPLAAYVIHELCAGLAAALASRAKDGSPLRWVHGELRPRVVHLSVTGEVKVSGFGFGCLKPERSAMPPRTVDERLLFLAPEQMKGAEPEARTDVFLVGAVLHDMLAGRLLDTEDAFEFMRELAKGTRPLMRDGIGVSPLLAQLLGTMLARQPADRPADVADVLARLARVPELGDPVRAARDLGNLVRQRAM